MTETKARGPTLGPSGETLSLRGTANGIAAALDWLDDAENEAAAAPEEWQFLRAELTRDPKRGQRIGIKLTLISTGAVHRLREERNRRD